MYAALDAYCLIEIYERIRAQYMTIKNPFVDFDEFVHSFLIENKNKSKVSVNKRNTQGATGNGNISIGKSQVRPTSNNKYHQQQQPPPPKARPHHRYRDDADASKQPF